MIVHELRAAIRIDAAQGKGQRLADRGRGGSMVSGALLSTTRVYVSPVCVSVRLSELQKSPAAELPESPIDLGEARHFELRVPMIVAPAEDWNEACQIAFCDPAQSLAPAAGYSVISEANLLQNSEAGSTQQDTSALQLTWLASAIMDFLSPVRTADPPSFPRPQP